MRSWCCWDVSLSELSCRRCFDETLLEENGKKGRTVLEAKEYNTRYSNQWILSKYVNSEYLYIYIYIERERERERTRKEVSANGIIH